MQMEAWGPLAEGKNNIFQHEVLTDLAAKHNKTVAQIILRWNTQHGVVVIPKSVHKERMQENFNIFDFVLAAEDMERIKALGMKVNLLAPLCLTPALQRYSATATTMSDKNYEKRLSIMTSISVYKLHRYIFSYGYPFERVGVIGNLIAHNLLVVHQLTL